MQLNNNRIMVRTVLNHPPARALLQRKFPQLKNPLVLAMAQNMTLEQALRAVGTKVSPQVIQETLRELEQL